MLCLGLDTTGQYCSAAVVDEGRILGFACHPMRRGHAEALAPMVAQVLDTAKVTPDQIARIGVCNGPGSFTGLRVALSFAKGFALAHKAEILGISALDVHAQAAGGTAIVAMDVRRSEVFWGEWKNTKCVTRPHLQSLSDFKAQFETRKPPSPVLIGTAVKALGSEPWDEPVNPAILGWLALERDPKDYPAQALYHRDADAKLPKGVKRYSDPSPKKKSAIKPLGSV